MVFLDSHTHADNDSDCKTRQAQLRMLTQYKEPAVITGRHCLSYCRSCQTYTVVCSMAYWSPVVLWFVCDIKPQISAGGYTSWKNAIQQFSGDNTVSSDINIAAP